MKTEANWGMRAWSFILALMVAFAASCGGGGGSVDLGSNQNDGDGGASVSNRSVGQIQLIYQEDIPSLPKWQQELLSDPGWNQPYITPRSETPVPAPSFDMLMEETRAAQERPVVTHPRVGTPESGKGVSWNDQAGYVYPTIIDPGEYSQLYAGAVPYGCKDGAQANGHSRDRNIAAVSVPLEAANCISYCLQGMSSANHFNSAGGAGNDSRSCVYQLFASDRQADPQRPYDDYGTELIPDFAEVEYRADGGTGSPGACDAGVSAYAVRGYFWWEFNSDFDALPGGNSTPLYNVLISASSDQSATETSSLGTDGRIQHFYLGDVSNCYGSGAIVSLSSADTGCADFDDIVNDAANGLFFTNPVYGVILKRWNDSVLASMPGGSDAWDGEFGWPVFGPVAYNGGGAVLTGQGAYYAWGMYFEKGFVWHIDYVNNTNVPDEAQAYIFTGSNVYCGDSGTYEKIPTVFYGGSGALGVSVVVEASLNPDRGPGTPAPGSFYEVGLGNDGLATVQLDMHAHGYGGTPRASDCAYKHYTWAFRDGSMGLTNSVAYDNSTQYCTHTYGSVDRNQMSIYIVRVQVVDSTGAIAYGDSLPIHLGSGSGGGGGEIIMVHNDGGDYPANHAALEADLAALGAQYSMVDYSDTVADDINATGEAKVVIWYRGGPGAAGETQPDVNRMWTSAEIDNYIQLMQDGYGVWLVSQSHGYQYDYRLFGFPNGWSGIYAYSVPSPQDQMAIGEVRHPWAASFATDDGIGFGGSYGFIPTGPSNFIGSPDGRFGGEATGAAERYTGAGSSGDTPISFDLGNIRQFCGVGYYGAFFANFTAGPMFTPGMNVNPTALGYDLGFLSYGNKNAPDENIGYFPSYQHTLGPGKLWVSGYSWAETNVTASSSGTMTRADVMRNILSWLDDSLTFSSDSGATTNQGFSEYEGVPEIVSVTPAYWDEANHMYRSGTPTLSYAGPAAGAFFPDQSSADLYRSSDNPALANEIITTDANNNWINGNDVDFQFPFYAYIDDGANNAVESGVGANAGNNWNNTDDNVFYRGLELVDTNNSWNRLTTAFANPVDQTTYPAIMKKRADQGTTSPMPWVSGFYGGADSGDETFASYGGDAHAFSGMGAGQEWKNDNMLTVEAIAHWSQTLKYFDFPPVNNPSAPKLNWSMYPGQNMAIPAGFTGAGQIIGGAADWDAFRKHFDVDPSFAAPNRTGSTWNRPAFSFTQPAADGRLVEFNYKKVKSWSPDLNRDGARTNADKFPIRCRLFSNHQAYFNKSAAAGSVWPNQMQNPGTPPPAGIQLPPTDPNYPSFIEGGCYVVDYGDPVYTVQIADDPAQLDPRDLVTFVGGSGPTYTWNVTMNYLIKFGTPNFTVELDPAYDGVFGPAVIVLSPGGGFTGGGAKSSTVPITAVEGNYSFAVRVTDQALPADTSTYVWPNVVNLKRPLTFAILSDPLSQGGNTCVSNLQADLGFLYGAGSVTTINLASGTLTSGQLNAYDCILWCSDVAFARTGGTWSSGNPNHPQAPFGFTYGVGNGNVNEVVNQVTNNGKTLFYAGGGARGLARATTIGTAVAPYTNATTWYFDGSTSTTYHRFVLGAANIPNVVGGFNQWRTTGRLGPPYECQNMSGTQGTTVKCVTGYFGGNTYAAGAYRQNIGAGLGKSFELNFNYGDMLPTNQGSTLVGGPDNRYHLLENMLCMGSAASKFNSPNT